MTMLFCPNCANILLARDESGVTYLCGTCSYRYSVNRDIVVRTEGNMRLAAEVEERVQNGDYDSTMRCPKCAFVGSFYHELQIRSADEAATIFYTCGEPTCGHKWNSDN
eukprot:TRINITY_DN5869_c0_g1_i1.p1 TRINITY_DN5869_c0_g1~~TRINITY_DN5869_c0_g1_i1.p1  ORF type:complete len:116 (+),score=7.89 TRINITY_DN5869_c0_g1_i1:22-348(+)